jgi:predicted nuclease with RNAse H fold
VRTLGVDLTSQPADTAIAGIEWPQGDVPRLIPFSQLESEPFTDERLIDLLDSQEWGRVAIEVPFGWPRSLLGLLERWRIGIPVELPAEMRAGHSEVLFRATDLVVWEQTGVRPSPVGLDKLAWVALRAFHILSAAGAHTDRAGLRSAVIETYPKAALTRWSDMPATSTKSGDAAPGVRADLVDRISAELALQIESEDRERLIAVGRDHRFDALLCALVARAAMLGRTTLPRPGPARELSEEEGWIHLPEEGSLLRGLASPSYEAVELPDRFTLDTLEL